MTVFNALGLVQGDIRVYVSKPGGHGPDFWTERAVEHIMAVADTAPQPIRDQAVAFQEKIAQVILYNMKSALAEQRAYDANKAGTVSPAAAEAIRGG